VLTMCVTTDMKSKECLPERIYMKLNKVNASFKLVAAPLKPVIFSYCATVPTGRMLQSYFCSVLSTYMDSAIFS
jgi:hypothetical protein